MGGDVRAALVHTYARHGRVDEAMDVANQMKLAGFPKVSNGLLLRVEVERLLVSSNSLLFSSVCWCLCT